MKNIELEIITPEKVVYKDTIQKIILPTSEGQITILPDHISLVTVTMPGEIVVYKENDTSHMAVMNGFVEFSDNKLKLMTDAAELAEEIDERRAEEAVKRSEVAKEKALNDVENAEASAALQRALIRIKVAQRKSRRH